MIRRTKALQNFIGATLAMAAIAMSAAHAAGPASLAPDRVAAIAAWLPELPSGIGPACIDRAAWTAPEVTRRLAPIIAAADKLVGQPFPAWDDKAYLEYTSRGTRPAGERMMNAHKAWIYPLALAECATWSGRYLPALQTALTEIDGQPSWTWPAHDAKLRNFRDHDFEVDLLAADTANDIAQALYMLGDRLAPDVRRRTLGELERRVFAPTRRTIRTGNRDNWWFTAEHNWNAVCLKGLVGAALAAIPDRGDRALFAAAGEQYIAHYTASFSTDGYDSEGPGYWNYGFSHFTELREILLAATGDRIDLFAMPKARAMALYGYRYEMQPGIVAPFGDASINTRFDDFTRAYANAAFALGQPQQLAGLVIDGRQSGNAAPLTEAAIMLFARPAPAAVPGEPLAIGLQSYFAATGVLVSRSAPGGRLAVTIKAGGNGNHSHDDIGAYAIGLDGEQPTGAAGATAYSAKTFSSARRTIRAINSWGHPVPLVDGQIQRDATKVHVRVLSTDLGEDADRIEIDLAPAYDVAGVQNLVRRLEHRRVGAESVVIEDRFAFDTPRSFETAIITGDFRQTGAGGLEVWRRQKHLQARIEASSAYEIVAEKVDEEGLAFTRVAVRLAAPQRTGFIRILYLPPG